MHREMAYVGGTLYAFGGLLVLFTAQFSPQEPHARGWVLAVSATAIVVGAFFLWSADRLAIPLWLYSVATSFGAILVTIAVIGGGPETTAVYGMLYVFVSTYGFYYYPWPIAIWLVALNGVGFSLALVWHDVDGAVAQWLMIVGASVIAGGLIGSLGQRNRRQVTIERDTVRELSALDAWKNTFLRAAAHDLRSPLAAILGSLRTIRDHDERLAVQQRRELVERTLSATERLSQLVSDLLDMERIEAGQIEPRLEDVSLDELVVNLVAQVDPKGRIIEVEAQPVVAAVEPAKVERIVDNLVGNAVKHTPPNCHIWVRVSADDGAAVVAVEDDGPGIDPDRADQLFEAFRGGSHPNGDSGGLGLGLHLVRQFTALHGGSVTASNRPGSGARFEVRLPLRQDGAPTAADT